MMSLEVILSLSILLQLAAGIMAVRLMRITGRQWAWVLMVAAILTILVRRVIQLVALMQGDSGQLPSPAFEWLGLAVSVFLIAGIALIEPVFRAAWEADQRIVELIEQQQQALGRDLHDDLVQMLVGAHIRCETLRWDLQAREDRGAADAARIGEILRNSLDRARQLARGLCPVGLEADRLCDALEILVTGLQSPGAPACRFHCATGPEDRLSPDGVIERQLYRIAQEAIANAIRHSGCQTIEVFLTVTEAEVCLRICDDGRGIPPQRDRASGVGLQSMAYRARVVGGVLEIGSGAEGGTEVACRIRRRSVL